MSLKSNLYQICEAPGCVNSVMNEAKAGQSLKGFFRFPLHSREKCLKWVEFAKLAHTWKGSTVAYYNHYLCEDHFEKRWFRSGIRKLLRPDAVPTIPFKNPTTEAPVIIEKIKNEILKEKPVNAIVVNTPKKVEDDSSGIQRCSAPSCNNFPKKGCEFLFHSFPFDNQPLLKLWTKSLVGERSCWVPKKYDIICSQHFYKSDYIVEDGVKFLKDDAIPVPHVVNEPEPEPEETPGQVLYIIQDSENIDNNLDKSQTKNEENDASEEHNYSLPTDDVQGNSTLLLYADPMKSVTTKCTQTIFPEEENAKSKKKDLQISELQNEVKSLQRKLYRRDLKLKNMCELIKHLKTRHT